jgi:hypothetical protein
MFNILEHDDASFLYVSFIPTEVTEYFILTFVEFRSTIFQTHTFLISIYIIDTKDNFHKHDLYNLAF